MSAAKVFGIIWLMKSFFDFWVCFNCFQLQKKWKNNNIGYEWIFGIGMSHLLMVGLIVVVFLFPEDYLILVLPLIVVFSELIILAWDFSGKFFYNDKYFCLGFDALQKKDMNIERFIPTALEETFVQSVWANMKEQ